MFHKILNVKALPNYLLWVEFRDGSEILYDASDLSCKHSSFQILSDNPELFFFVSVDTGGYGISWNDELDISSEELWNNGVVLKESVELSPGQNCPVCRQMIRRKSTVQATASRANLEKRTHKGGRPINPNSKRQKNLA